ncbi:MAG: XrtA system polysaccharide chain length determinant, partial [Steroidobacteraceae bacterium]
MAFPPQKILTIVHSAWRFRWSALCTAWVVALAGWASVLAIPGRYETNAQVYVDTSTLLRPLLEGLTVSANTNSQVDLVRQALIARPQLEKVIDSTILRARATTPAARESIVNALGRQIRIVTDRGSRNYNITYSDSDPRVSYEVVQALLQAFLGQSVEASRNDAESAQAFLQKQLAEYEARLIESESKLADFKRNNLGSMPDDRGGYFERTQAEMQELDRLGASLSVATHRRDQLRQRLLGGNRAASNSQTASSFDGRIAEARGKLDEMLLNFTDVHPDVIALQQTINSLEAQRKRELEDLRSNVDTLGAARSNSVSLVTQNLQIALNEVDVEIASTRAQIADRQRRVSELRGAINTLPKVEAELARLTRDYGSNRAQYDALLRRLESARLSDQAQKSQTVDFRTLSPPVMPLMPASPQRSLLAIGVLFFALAAGAGMAYLRSVMRPVYLNVD